MNQEKTGKLISYLRKKKGLTQKDFAEKLCVSDRAVSNWENGRNMPDIALYKEICKLLDISIDELVNGEIIIKDKVKSHKKLSINIVVFISILIVLFIIYVIFKNTKIDIYNINVISNGQSNINNKLSFEYENKNVYFYGVDSFNVSNIRGKKYNLKEALKNNKISINDIKVFFETQYQNGFIKKETIYDGGTIIYNGSKYSAIFCKTLEGNNDIYFGNQDMIDNLDGHYCGQVSINECHFIRTYTIVNIALSNEEEYMNVTLKEFQGESAIVKINRSYSIKVGSSYEFEFSTNQKFDDSINNIFLNSTLFTVTETNKTGLEQKNEKICLSNF